MSMLLKVHHELSQLGEVRFSSPPRPDLDEFMTVVRLHFEMGVSKTSPFILFTAAVLEENANWVTVL